MFYLLCKVICEVRVEVRGQKHKRCYISIFVTSPLYLKSAVFYLKSANLFIVLSDSSSRSVKGTSIKVLI